MRKIRNRFELLIGAGLLLATANTPAAFIVTDANPTDGNAIQASASATGSNGSVGVVSFVSENTLVQYDSERAGVTSANGGWNDILIDTQGATGNLNFAMVVINLSATTWDGMELEFYAEDFTTQLNTAFLNNVSVIPNSDILVGQSSILVDFGTRIATGQSALVMTSIHLSGLPSVFGIRQVATVDSPLSISQAADTSSPQGTAPTPGTVLLFGLGGLLLVSRKRQSESS